MFCRRSPFQSYNILVDGVLYSEILQTYWRVTILLNCPVVWRGMLYRYRQYDDATTCLGYLQEFRCPLGIGVAPETLFQKLCGDIRNEGDFLFKITIDDQ